MHARIPQSDTQTAGLPVDRYPGVQPFGDTREDRLRFFGRDEETSVLLHQLLGVDMLVLFAKPGLGKTSLLRVRLFPCLRDRDFLPVPVRFNHADPALTPMQVFTTAIEETCAAEAIDYTAGDPNSLWALFKTAIFWRGDRLQTPVLILDQFEEIFTLQGEEFRHAAAAELGQLLGSRLPEHIRQQLQAGQPLPFSDRPPEVKVLLSLREDELGMLQELTPELPAILQHRFRLTGLPEADARRAVTEPAGLVADDVPFATDPFVYDETTVAELMATARTKDGDIDPFVLQIFCGHIERQVRQRQAAGMPAASPLVVVRSDLQGGKGRKAPPATFYLETLDRLPGWIVRRRARRLCEDGLLTGDGRRRSLLQEDLKEDFNLNDASLELLEQARLLRKEARAGGLYYEVSHDRLAEAIRDGRRWRLPRGVKIGLAMVVAVVIVAAGLYAYFTADNQRRAQMARAEAERVLEYIIFDLQDRLTNLGGQALLDDIQREVDAYYERMGSLGESDAVLRRKASALTNRGNLLVNRGHLASALAVYQSALIIQKQLAARDPSHTGWQRDLSVSHNKIGDVQHAQGDLAAALTAYQASLQIRERLAARDPSHTEWQRDLSVSHDKIGDVQHAQGDLAAALTAYQASLQIAERLAARDPSHTEWQRDLSVSHNKIGDVQHAQGDLAAALTAYQASLQIAERLAARDPSHTGWQRDLSVSHNKIGDVQHAQGDLAAALTAYQASLQIAERLAARDPSHTGWQRDLSVSHNKIGDVQRAQGDLAAALTAYQASLQIAERLAARDPSHTEWQTDLVLTLYRTATVLKQHNPPRKEAAVAAYQRGLDILRPLAAENRLTVGQRGWIAIIETHLDALKD